MKSIHPNTRAIDGNDGVEGNEASVAKLAAKAPRATSATAGAAKNINTGVRTASMEEEGEGEAEVGANAMDAEDHQTAGNPDGPAAANRTDMHTAHGQRKRCGSIEWNKQESGNWRWSSELHGKDSELKKQKLGEVAGQSEPTESWTFHDAYCGIGGVSAGLKLAGGVCTGAFDQCARARKIYTERCGFEPHGAWGTFDSRSWAPADVLFSAPPCENVGQLIGRNGERQMWKQLKLVQEFKYKVVVVEVLLHFKKMHQGQVFRDFSQALAGLGYAVNCGILFAPDFASAAARRRVYLIGVRNDLHKEKGDFVLPVGRSRHHPLSSILEPEYFRRGVRVKTSSFNKLEQPKQRSKQCLRQLGEMSGTGPGRVVYSTQAPASSQTATGRGPGWTSGLYEINGTVSRLTVREVARLMQISDSVDMDEVEAVAKRHLGNTTPVGVSRGIGSKLEKYLSSDLVAARSKLQSEVGDGDSQRLYTLTPDGRELAKLLHEAKQASWKLCDAARAAVKALIPNQCCRLRELTSTQISKVRRGIEVFHRRRWLVLQKRRGDDEVQNMINAGVDAKTVRRARYTIQKALFLERMRAGNEEGPINLLWWNWQGPVPQELLKGYELPLQRQPPAVFADNYDSADVEKVWEEFARMTERRYMEGPFEKNDGKVYMTHPMAAVVKKGSDKLRIVIDMTATLLNDCLTAHRFILPQVSDVASRCYPGAWMTTCDLQDGFYGIEVRGEDRKYLGLRHPRTGKYYRYTRLAMGAACSPSAFSRLVAWAMREARNYEEFKVEEVIVNDTDPNMPRVYGVGKDGVPVATMSWFVDDGCIIAPTKERCAAAYRRLTWILESRLGWRICRRKTCGPAQRIEFCGLELDSIGKDVGGPCTRLSEERRQKCLASLRTFKSRYLWKGRAPRRDMASLVGELSFAANAIPAGRCFLARLYDAIHEKGEEKTGEATDYDREVRVSGAANLDVRWWETCLEEATCVRLWRTKGFALHRCWSDASNYGFAECIAVDETGEFPKMQFTHGVWPDAVAGFSSNWHELATIVHSIKTRFQQLRDSQIHYMTDNATAVRAVNTGTVDSVQLMELSRELKLLQAKGNIGIEAVHLPGTMMQLQGTDQASRSMPFMGMYSGQKGKHDLYSPKDWPLFELNGSIVLEIEQLRVDRTVDASAPALWYDEVELAGKDSFLHLRPCHVSGALEGLLEAQLRRADTSFTVIAPAVGTREWSKYLKHFRRKEIHKVYVQGLGEVKHWLLRFEAGDGLLPRGQGAEDEQQHGDVSDGE